MLKLFWGNYISERDVAVINNQRYDIWIACGFESCLVTIWAGLEQLTPVPRSNFFQVSRGLRHRKCHSMHFRIPIYRVYYHDQHWADHSQKFVEELFFDDTNWCGSRLKVHTNSRASFSVGVDGWIDSLLIYEITYAFYDGEFHCYDFIGCRIESVG